MNKKELSEIDICDQYITPAIKNAGWDMFTQIRREVTLTPGPIIVRGEMSARNKKKKKFADYVLRNSVIHRVPHAASGTRTMAARRTATWSRDWDARKTPLMTALNRYRTRATIPPLRPRKNRAQQDLPRFYFLPENAFFG